MAGERVPQAVESGLVQHPWRAYFILAAAFVALQLATLVVYPIVQWIGSHTWTYFRVSPYGGYHIWDFPDEIMIIAVTIQYSCLYVIPYLMVVTIISRQLPAWMALALGLFFGVLYALYSLSLADNHYGYYRALEAYVLYQLVSMIGLIFCLLYRLTVSVRRYSHNDY